MIGRIIKEDFTALTVEPETVLQHESSLFLLLDLEKFSGEELSLWGSDLKFGRKFRKRIVKLAEVGDNKW